MGSFEWMELQTLTSDINASRSRLAQARAHKDHRLIRMLEGEIGAAEGRRDRLLADISTHLAGTPEPATEGKKAKAAERRADIPAEAAAARDDGVDEPRTTEIAEQPDAGSRKAAGESGSVKGGIVMWDKLTPADLNRAQNELGGRRTELLARHAEEMKALEGEQTELESLEQAIQAFLRRFNPSAAEADAEGSVVKLGEERELRVQGRG